MDKRICVAIQSKRCLEFSYDGLFRVVEPHAHGMSGKGSEIMLAFQSDGKSSSGLLGWRMWTTAKIESLVMTEDSFTEVRPGYVRGGSHIHQAHCEL